jgi:nitronate monooxygenase
MFAFEDLQTMPLPAAFRGRLRLPAIAAPMFLVSGPDLVVEACKAGVIGTFPALNQRTTEGFDAWLDEIEGRLGPGDAPATAPYGVNLIVHKSNPRVDADLEICVRHKVPLIITSLGAVPELVDEVHAYGGVVFHDVINMRHARKAAGAGVDGLILVCAGAGGHAGLLSPFALLPEVRAFFDGAIVLSGCISDGRAIAAAITLGADLAYLGTRFIATAESTASPAYKEMLVASAAADIIYTPAVSGIHGSFLRPSIAAAGYDPDDLPDKGKLQLSEERKSWQDVWSAGQGVGQIREIPRVRDLVDRLAAEYDAALDAMAAARRPVRVAE